MGDYLEKKILTAAGVVVSIFGGVLLLMAAGSVGLALVGALLGELRESLISAAAAIPLSLAGLGALSLGLCLRLEPLTLKNLARSAGETVAFLISGFWTMRMTSGAKVPAWEMIAYLLVLSGFVILNINRFRKPEAGERPAGK